MRRLALPWLLLLVGCGAPRLPEGLPPPEYERPAPRQSQAGAAGGFGGAAARGPDVAPVLGGTDVAPALGGAGAGGVAAGGSAGSGP